MCSREENGRVDLSVAAKDYVADAVLDTWNEGRRIIAELEAENARLLAAASDVLADALVRGYQPDDCPDWFEGMISCDSLNALNRVHADILAAASAAARVMDGKQDSDA